MGRRGDDDGLDVFIRQKGLVILGLQRSRRGGGASAQERRVRVADRRNFGLLQPAQSGENFPAPGSQPDHSTLHFFGRSFRGRRFRRGLRHQGHSPQQRHQGGSRSSFEKIATVKFVFGLVCGHIIHSSRSEERKSPASLRSCRSSFKQSSRRERTKLATIPSGSKIEKAGCKRDNRNELRDDSVVGLYNTRPAAEQGHRYVFDAYAAERYQFVSLGRS